MFSLFKIILSFFVALSKTLKIVLKFQDFAFEQL